MATPWGKRSRSLYYNLAQKAIRFDLCVFTSFFFIKETKVIRFEVVDHSSRDQYPPMSQPLEKAISVLGAWPRAENGRLREFSARMCHNTVNTFLYCRIHF